MKVCWDNLEKIRYIGNGVWKKHSTKQLCIEKECMECRESFLAWGTLKTHAKNAKFCNLSCAISYRNKGRSVSDETRRKTSISLKGEKNPNFRRKNTEHSVRMSGRGNPMFGRMHNSKTRASISNKAKTRLSIPENNPNWRGGLSFEEYCFVFRNKEWREYILHRDSDKFCWNPQCMSKGTKEVLHHINYNKKDCRYSNIIKICNSCNTAANYNRDWWQSFFKAVMRKRDLGVVQ